MNHPRICRALALAVGLAGFAAGAAHAALPPKTPAQQQAAAEKKVKDDAQAAKDKQSLSDSMDAIAARYRVRAKAQGWTTHPAVAIAAAPAKPAAGAGGITSAANNEGPAGQPNGKLTEAGANAPKTSEKFGTAPASADVKAGPTPTLPAGTPPTVQKGTPKVKNK
ncbi:hypothetical protein [Massilia sp. 9096]|uniref:hypothetical protein n=1 Tax=Massilia sp. 9096 TaxID=1500894 RepID=UPI000566C16C|nr:hypothetical protein [Massilia sp. 9096]